MKAWRLEDIGDIKYYEDFDIPEIKDEEVLVRVKAAGVCGSDIPRVFETGAHNMPITIGHEFAGVVEKIGCGVEKKWEGKRVGIFPLIPCKNCSSCLKKQYEMCEHYSYLGSRCDGGFAEYVAVPAWNLIEIPNEVSFEQAAMLEPMAVAVHAIRHMKIDLNMKAAVCGLGTIGQLIIMFLAEQGVKTIYAIGNKSEQLQMTQKLGISDEYFFNASDNDAVSWLQKKTNGVGVDLFFECVGKNETVLTGIEGTAAGGQVCLVGNPYSDISLAKNIYWRILRKQITLKGTWNSSFLGEYDLDSGSDDWSYVIDCLRKGKVNPEKLITHRYSLAELGDALELMKDKKEPYSKVMIKI